VGTLDGPAAATRLDRVQPSNAPEYLARLQVAPGALGADGAGHRHGVERDGELLLADARLDGRAVGADLSGQDRPRQGGVVAF